MHVFALPSSLLYDLQAPVFKFGNCLGFGWSAANFVLGFRASCVAHELQEVPYGSLSIQLLEGLRFAARDSIQSFRVVLSMVRFGVWCLLLWFDAWVRDRQKHHRFVEHGLLLV